ncbi:hypothetical protein [Streptomyces sp. NBC_00690]|uniref:hypothetical protein n=1 Tax=Streptomyces sp. NBC_00690 TaxID=2975808 RepID=UPI002E288E46|nr:hypothetical protein [Streptomyces sp. NBC_00690]
MSTIDECVRNVVVRQLGVRSEAELNDASFSDCLGADSPDPAELVISAGQSILLRREIPQQLGTELPEGKTRDLTAVGELLACVEERIL